VHGQRTFIFRVALYRLSVSLSRSLLLLSRLHLDFTAAPSNGKGKNSAEKPWPRILFSATWKRSGFLALWVIERKAGMSRVYGVAKVVACTYRGKRSRANTRAISEWIVEKWAEGWKVNKNRRKDWSRILPKRRRRGENVAPCISRISSARAYLPGAFSSPWLFSRGWRWWWWWWRWWWWWWWRWWYVVRGTW
jgi:hypothetical protein